MAAKSFTSSFLLVAANSVPLWGVLFQGWKLFPIVFLYWLESAIVGVFNIVKIRRIEVEHRAKPVANAGLDTVFFFLFHYGLFMGVHGILILVFFWPPTIPIRDMFIAFLSLLVSHAFSYRLNFLGSKEYEKISADAQMIRPYGRILIMHFTILFGGILSQAFGAPPLALIVMIGAKLALDLWSHVQEHLPLADD